MDNYKFVINSQYCHNSSLAKDGIGFSFIINGNEFTTTQFHASVISNTVRDIIMTDQSVSYINITIPTNDGLRKALNIFSSLLKQGFVEEDIDINVSECLYELGIILNNADFIEQYKKHLSTCIITKENLNIIYQI